jgi:hypothetical protein
MKKLLVIVFMAAALSAYSQKVKLIEGDLKPLKGQTSINTEFTYDGLVIGDDAQPEAEYVAEKKADHNKKEAGKGDKWEAGWIGAREKRYHPKFRELFTRETKMATEDASAKYTLIFKTTKIEPGYNVGVRRKNAYISGEAWIVETANKDNVIAKI